MFEQQAILNILISLLRESVAPSDEPSVKKDALTKDTLEKLYKYSKAHDLAHLVGNALTKYAPLEDSAEIFNKFLKNQYAALYRYEGMNYESERIFSLLESHKIPFIPLKGAVIRDLYPEPWMRTSCDIDVLVHEKDLKEAVGALTDELSYKTQGARNYHDISLFSESGVHLELHFNILEDMKSIDKLLSRVWEYSVPDGVSKYRYRTTNEFLMFHMIAHMSYHFVCGGCGIRSLLDLYVLSQKAEFDENKVRKMCAECETEKFYDAVMKLCRVWFSGETPDELTEALGVYIFNGGVYGTLENKVSVQNVRKGGSFKYLLSRVFGSYDMMKVRYPILVRHKWMMPFCQIHRWFSRLARGKFGHTVKELKKSSEVDHEKIDSVSALLKELGLHE